METGVFACQYCERENFFDETGKKFSALIEKADLAEKQSQSLRSDLDQQRKKSESLQKTLTTMTLDTELLRKKHEELTAKYEEMAKENKEALAALSVEIQNANGKNREATEEIGTLKKELAENHRRYSKLSDLAEGHVKKVSAANAEIQALKKLINDKDVQIAGIQRGEHSETVEEIELRVRTQLEKDYQNRLDKTKQEMSARFDDAIKKLTENPTALSESKKKA